MRMPSLSVYEFATSSAQDKRRSSSSSLWASPLLGDELDAVDIDDVSGASDSRHSFSPVQP